MVLDKKKLFRIFKEKKEEKKEIKPVEKSLEETKQEQENKTFEVRQGIVKEIFVKSPLEEKYSKALSEKKTIKIEVKKNEEIEPVSFDFFKKNEELQKGSMLTLLIIPSEEYTKDIFFLSKHLSEKYQKVLYISLNELYSNILANFKSQKINIEKFYFIDAITSTAETNPQKQPNCTFVVSPNSLVELSLAISSAVENKKPQVILFDSLSTLLIYENQKTVLKFVHALIGKIKAAKIDAFFTALEGDSKSQAIKDLGMFVDDFLTIDKFKMYRIEMELKPAK